MTTDDGARVAGMVDVAATAVAGGTTDGVDSPAAPIATGTAAIVGAPVGIDGTRVTATAARTPSRVARADR